MADLENLKKRLHEDHPLDAPTGDAVDAIVRAAAEIGKQNGNECKICISSI